MNQRTLGFVTDLLNWPRRAIVMHILATVVTGNALQKAISGSYVLATQVYQDAPANGDVTTNGFFLRPGTYTMNVTGFTNTNRGIVDWYIDDAIAVTGQDWYASPGVDNVIKTATVQVKGLSPYHVLKSTVNGKNASSSDYYLALSLIEFKPCAD